VEWWLAYMCLGAVVGFFAGLFGIGGGLIMVPVLSFLFGVQGFVSDFIVHLALGTSMAAIIFTSIPSLLIHHMSRSVNWNIVRLIMPGIIFGTFCGVALAHNLPGRYLSIFIILFIYYFATRMVINSTPNPNRILPGKIGIFTVGGFIGGLSSLVAIGGGTLTIPFLSACNVRLKHAIGISAPVSCIIAIVGTIGYIYSGITHSQILPEYSLGYIYLPALAGIVAFSMATAIIGAKVTHIIETKIIRKIFVILLYILGTKMLISLF
tara:strand:+ start:2362 stop:3159 length:798 start_codon:yes stop_codon:yes gene_type:complete